MGLKKLFRNYYYGNPAKRDYTEADMPSTRTQLFKEVLKARRESMLSLNLLYLVIWLPAVVWSGINLIPLLYTQIDDPSAYFFTYCLFLFPLTAITGPCTAGISYVMRNWARDEHSFVFSDFMLGLKNNWKQALALSTINGALPLAVFIGMRFYWSMAKTASVFYLPMVLLALMACLWSVSAQLMPTMMVTYALSFRDVVKNCVLLTLATLPRAIAIRLATLALPIAVIVCALFFPSAVVAVGAIAVVAYLLFMLSLNKLITASFANYACEKYYNPRIEGARVNIGLRSDGAEK